jgi:hypothetical protein
MWEHLLVAQLPETSALKAHHRLNSRRSYSAHLGCPGKWQSIFTKTVAIFSL